MTTRRYTKNLFATSTAAVLALGLVAGCSSDGSLEDYCKEGEALSSGDFAQDIDPNDPLGYIRDLVEDDPNAIIVYFADDHASNSNALRGTSIVDILEEKGIDANKATLIPIGNDEVKKAFPTADTPIVFYIILGLSEREAETLIGEVYVPTDHG